MRSQPSTVLLVPLESMRVWTISICGKVADELKPLVLLLIFRCWLNHLTSLHLGPSVSQMGMIPLPCITSWRGYQPKSKRVCVKTFHTPGRASVL